jgi:hypothetical protein
VAELRTVVGDATNPQRQGTGPIVVAHVVNDVGAWGGGFVLALNGRWPDLREGYRAWFNGDLIEGEVGHLVAPAFELGQVQFLEAEPGIIVANMLAQHDTRPDAQGRPPLRARALYECLERVQVFCAELGASVHCPMFGSGLAGGKWPEIEGYIRELLVAKGIDVTVYEFQDTRARSYVPQGGLFGGRRG